MVLAVLLEDLYTLAVAVEQVAVIVEPLALELLVVQAVALWSTQVEQAVQQVRLQ
jgi:hypothetical protein